MNYIIGAHYNGTLNTVLKLPYISGPFIIINCSSCTRLYRIYFFTVLLGKVFDKGSGQKRNILLAFTQGRHMNMHYIQSKIKIFPKISFFYFFYQIPVCCGDYPCIYAESFRTSYPLKLFFLKNTQKFYLYHLVDFAYFVQKKRTAVCNFKAASAALYGPCKGSFFMAEKLGLQKAFGKGSAVNLNKGLILTV